MIGFDNCSVGFSLNDERKHILRDATMLFPKVARVCVIAPANSGKTTIAHLLAGFTRPDRGSIMRNGNISWPVGFSGALHPSLTGAANVRIIADIAGVSADDVLAYVAEFSELGTALDERFQTYSSTMRSQLATALSIAIPAETYVVDNVVGSGSPIVRAKSELAFEQRLQDAGLFMITSSLRMAERFGQDFYVLENGKFQPVVDFDQGKAWLEKQAAHEDDLSFIADGLSRS